MPLPSVRYQPLGPVLAGEGSRAFLGLEVAPDGVARPVVLVWVPEEALGKPEVISRIRKETEHASTLDHPNILKVHGFASLEDGHARITEFADGESLRKMIETVRSFPAPLAARIVADAAMGVHFAHLAGNDDGSPLIHGDLRPETVMVSFSGATKVSGYGALSVAPKELNGNRVTGRRSHCAPEQVIGGRTNLLPQTDVYLLGLMLHECISGMVAFNFEPDFDQAVLTKALPALTEAEIPPALFAVIEKATAKKATDRYATPLELREAIEAAMGTLPSQSELAAFLAQHFPENNSSRTARRQEIDNGIADLARTQWARPAGPPANGHSPVVNGREPSVIVDESVSTPAAPLRVEAPKRPAPAAKAAAPKPAPRPRPVAEDTELSDPAYPVARRSETVRKVVPLAVAGVMFASVVAIVVRSGNKPEPVAAAPVPIQQQVAPPQAPSPAAEAAATSPAAAAEPAPAAEPEAAPAAAAPTTPAPVEEASSLEIKVEPAVEVSIAGKSYGTSPISVPMPPGRYVVQLADKARGISTTRTVVVRKSGKTSESISLSRGFVTVSAPPGATVFIDNQQRGRAPLPRELSVYEGNHKIMVTVGKAKWQQAFTVRSGERLYFNVETQ